MSYEEDPPTRRLPIPPREPQGREPHPREPLPPREPVPPLEGRPVAAAGDVQLYALEQQLRSVRSWLVALAVLAAVALGVAAWALLSDDDGGSASEARTPAALRKSVERLEERVEDRATKGDVSDLQEDIADLKTSVSEASASAGDATTTQATEAPDVSGLQNEVSDLKARVDALEQASSAEGTATEGTTP